MKFSKYRLIILPVLLVLILNLYFVFKPQKKYTRSFYYWKNSLEFDSSELSGIKKLGLKHLYIRYFDVVWSESACKPVPAGRLEPDYFEDTNMQFLPFTPCIYISNAVFERIEDNDIHVLARKIAVKMTKINIDFYERMFHLYVTKNFKYKPENGYYGSDYWEREKKFRDSCDKIFQEKWQGMYREIQLDCDWTVKTKDKYFKFLKIFKSQFADKTISATLRLWQYKYPKKAGIPPVDRCMLMCYSTGNPAIFTRENSIAGKNEIRSYLAGGHYNLPLDVALPLFSWNLLYRQGRLMGIIPDVPEKLIRKDTSTFKPMGDNLFMFRKDTVCGNIYIRYGDILKNEQLSNDDLKQIIKLVRKEVKLDNCSKITFFSWDEKYIEQYGIRNIEDFYKLFGR